MKNFLRFIAKFVAVFFVIIGIVGLAKVPGSLQGGIEEVIGVVLATVISFALAWWLWRRWPALSPKDSSVPPLDERQL
jgi:protein-S-isoprenylcysteine O-methyltransferase Ste14